MANDIIKIKGASWLGHPDVEFDFLNKKIHFTPSEKDLQSESPKYEDFEFSFDRITGIERIIEKNMFNNQEYYYFIVDGIDYVSHFEGFQGSKISLAVIYINKKDKNASKEFDNVLSLLLKEIPNVSVKPRDGYKAPKKFTDKDFTVTAEVKKRCNVCGTIFCYTLEDYKKSLNNQLSAATSALGAAAGAFAGNAMVYHANNVDKQHHENQIVDFNKCPHCGSIDLVELTDEEFNELKNKPEQTKQDSTSVVDQLKQLKELLDLGIITQDEFDAKKKQLLGL